MSELTNLWRVGVLYFNFISPTVASSGGSGAKLADTWSLLTREASWHVKLADTCYQVGVVRDGPGKRHSVTACSSQPRQRTVLVSSSNSVSFEFAGKVTVGLALHQPCVTDFSGLSSCRLKTKRLTRWRFSVPVKDTSKQVISERFLAAMICWADETSSSLSADWTSDQHTNRRTSLSTTTVRNNFTLFHSLSFSCNKSSKSFEKSASQRPHWLQWDAWIHPQNCLFPFDDHYQNLIHPYQVRPHSPPQTACGSNQPFCHNTHVQTDRWDGRHFSNISALCSLFW